MSDKLAMIDPAVFQHLQDKIDEEAIVREELRNVLRELEKHGRNSQSVLARAHSTTPKDYGSIAQEAEISIKQQAETIAALSQVASKHPYYKYNDLWTRDVQNTCFAVLFCGWLGGLAQAPGQGEQGRLMTLEEVGSMLQIPVNLKDRDAFHLTIEEYLHSLITLVDELARLAVNAVTLGDYEKPLQISRFIKDIHAGFQILNLKNDSLRRRSDSIKYSVKKVEDVVYDLSLRKLIPSQN